MGIYRGLLWMCTGLVAVGCMAPHGPLPDPVDRTGADVSVARRGRDLTLTGSELTVGEPFPDVVLTSRRGDKIRLSDYRGKVLLLSVVPELGTAVCDRSTRLLEASDLLDVENVVVFTISSDTWGEQAEWSRVNEVRRHMTLSDGDSRVFGKACGLLVVETNYLARCVMVVDKDGVIRWIETQQEMSRMPNFAAAQKLARRLAAE